MSRLDSILPAPERTVAWATAGVIVAVVLLAADGYVSLRNAAVLQFYQGWVEHTYDAQRQVERIDAKVSELISRERSYVLTGYPASLQEYDAIRAGLPGMIDAFGAFTNDNPAERADVGELRGRVEAEFAVLGRHIADRRAGRSLDEEQEAAAPSRTGMAEVRATLEKMRVEETRQLGPRQAQAAKAYTVARWTFVTATLISIGLISLVYFVLARGVRTRKRAAVEREMVDRNNRLLLESTGEGIYGVDLDGRCTFLNAAGAKTLGMEPADAVGKRMHDVTHHHKVDGTPYPAEECCIYNAYRVGKPCRVSDEVFFKADGTSFPVEYSAYPITDAGRTLGAVVTFVDISQRRRDEEAVRESSERFRTMADNIPQLAWMADGKGSLFWYNQRWFEYTGTTLEQMRGSGWKSVHDPDKVESVAAKFVDSVQAGTEWEDTFPLRGADGTYRWFLSRAVPVKNDAGRIVRWFGTNTDITQSRQVEQRLRDNEESLKAAKEEADHAKESAEAANVSKSQFLANMSHELRTPLNAVIMYSELLQEEAEDQAVEGFIPDLEKIRTAGKHLLALVNGVLDLSKIEAGKMELYLETFDVGQMVRDVAVTIEPLIMKKNNKVRLDVAPGVGDMHADLTKVRQILFNLLSNASKFTERGTVAVEVRREAVNGADRIQFRVSDTGIGMTPEQLAKLFQPFTQADASTTRKFGGTGLGLAISKRFAEMMGGSITVASEMDKGSTFELSIPPRVSKPASPDDVRGQSTGEQFKGAGRVEGMTKVLVIDDEPSVRDLLSKSLASESIAAYTAADGEEGLRLAKEIRPDLIFLDVLMPKMDGWAVLTALKADPALDDVPVVMLTMMTDQEMGYLLGASEYLTKPIDRNRLLSVMRKYKPVADADGVLIVEDDEATRQVLRRTMVKEGWNVTEAHNGRVALDRVRARLPNLILLDLMMPEMDGFEFLAELRHHVEWQDVPVVVLTSKDLTADERSMLSGKVERILQKGAYSRDALLKEVKKIVHDCTLRGLTSAECEADKATVADAASAVVEPTHLQESSADDPHAVAG